MDENDSIHILECSYPMIIKKCEAAFKIIVEKVGSLESNMKSIQAILDHLFHQTPLQN